MSSTLDSQYIRKSEQRRLDRWNVKESSQKVEFIDTSDGWTLALSSYTKKPNKKYPVLLCHGLGANRLAFDVDKQASLALHLANQGYDVYALDLRGHGKSQKPRAFSDKRWGWGFNDYCHKDLPAAIDHILQQTGKPKLHYIGHSMGGVLLYSRAAVQDPRIQSAITIGSSLDYSGTDSIFHSLIKFKALGNLLPAIPVHWPSLFSSWGAKYSEKLIDSVLVNPPNVNLNLYRKMAAVTLHPVSSKVLFDLAGSINGEGLLAPDGSRYSTLLKDRGYPFPILSLAGAADKQCPPVAAKRFGTQHLIFGKTFGHAHDYGHDDLIMGKNAKYETWPEIITWLEKNEGVCNG